MGGGGEEERGKEKDRRGRGREERCGSWSGVIHIHSFSVTSRGSNGDPFVDEQGRLDFSAAGVEDEGRYRCTAVDELGVQVEQEFYVEVTHVSKYAVEVDQRFVRSASARI